jgi:transcriptional regulator with XRE-family HTH domain
MTKQTSATEARYFRTFLLMQQFAAQEIGARIAQARREADGMTQETLADALDLSVRQLQNIEAGASIPWKHFSRLEAIFDRSLSWFLHGEDQPARATAERELADLAGRLGELEARVAAGFEANLALLRSLSAAVDRLEQREPRRSARAR